MKDASIIANFQSIDITTLPPKLHQRVEYLHAERECEDYEQLDSDRELEESELEESEPKESDHQQM